MIERISDIKAQSVNAESFDPHFYAAKQMVCDGRILRDYEEKSVNMIFYDKNGR